MKKIINVAISAKDYENPELLIIINAFSENYINLIVFNRSENKTIKSEFIKNQNLLNIISAFLADAKHDYYLLKNSDYSELFIQYVELIAYFIISDCFNASLLYNEITLESIKEI